MPTRGNDIFHFLAESKSLSGNDAGMEEVISRPSGRLMSIKVNLWVLMLAAFMVSMSLSQVRSAQPFSAKQLLSETLSLDGHCTTVDQPLHINRAGSYYFDKSDDFLRSVWGQRLRKQEILPRTRGKQVRQLKSWTAALREHQVPLAQVSCDFIESSPRHTVRGISPSGVYPIGFSKVDASWIAIAHRKVPPSERESRMM